MLDRCLYFLLNFFILCKIIQGNFVGKNFSLVLVGGGLDDNNKEIWNEIVTLGGGAGKARFGVIAAAGADPCCDVESSFFLYNKLLTLYGAIEVYYIPVTTSSKQMNSDEEVVNHIYTLSGFFFTGGDQEKVIYSLYNSDEKVPSPVLQAIRKTLLATGGVVAGTSAGTDCQTAHTMIAGGTSYSGLVEGTKMFWRSGESLNPNKLTAYGPGGIGLFTSGLVDTHFANRGRQGRLIQLLIDSSGLPTGSTLGFGIDENTALIITGDWTHRTGSVIGQRGVLVLDISEANNNNNNGTIDYQNIKAMRLSTGDSLDFNFMKLVPADYKTNMKLEESSDDVATTNNVFEEDTFQFDLITKSLFKTKALSTYGLSNETNPQIFVTISKTDFSAGYDGVDPVTGLYAYSYEGMRIDVNSK